MIPNSEQVNLARFIIGGGFRIESIQKNAIVIGGKLKLKPTFT